MLHNYIFDQICMWLVVSFCEIPHVFVDYYLWLQTFKHHISTLASGCNELEVRFMCLNSVFLRCFRDPIWVPRIENRVPRISENHHRVLRIKENRVPRIREIGALQVHIGYLTFSLKKLQSVMFSV